MAEPITPRDRVLAALRRERIFPVPVGAVTQSASLDQMEALSIRWPEAHQHPQQLAGLAEGARKILGFDMVRVPFDQTIEAELLGARVHYGDLITNCSIRSHPLSIGDSMPQLPDLGLGRARTVIEALELLERRLGRSAAIIGGITGPFTLVCQLAGAMEVLLASMRRPESIQPYLDFAISLGADYANRQVDAGADVICVEDMSASLDLTSPAIYRTLILPAQERLICAIRAPVILHICGGNTKILDLMMCSGAAALSLEARTDLASAVQMGKCAVVGGVAPTEVLLAGGIEDVRSASLACLRAGVHILAPGCGIPVNTPTDNLKEMARVAREWRS